MLVDARYRSGATGRQTAVLLKLLVKPTQPAWRQGLSLLPAFG